MEVNNSNLDSLDKRGKMDSKVKLMKLTEFCNTFYYYLLVFKVK